MLERTLPMTDKTLFLHPDDADKLRRTYDDVFKTAEELYIASAFLTDWSLKVPMSARCRTFVALIGTDFGLTRKSALGAILKWTPARHKCNLMAVSMGGEATFHPKVVAWRAADGCHVLIGSSNLTAAAIGRNVEANVAVSIDEAEFARIRKWIEELSHKADVITPVVIKNYKEAEQKRMEAAEKPSGTDHSQAGPAVGQILLRQNNEIF